MKPRSKSIALRKLLKQTTPGPIELNKSDCCIIGIHKPVAPGLVIRIADAFPDASDVTGTNAGNHRLNAAFITHAYNTMPDLFNELTNLVARIENHPNAHRLLTKQTHEVLKRAARVRVIT